MPLHSLGFAAEIGYLARYTHEIARAPVDEDAVKGLLQQTTDSQPMVALCLRPSIDAPADVLEESATDRLGPYPPLHRNRRQLFGIGGTAIDYQQTLMNLSTVLHE